VSDKIISGTAYSAGVATIFAGLTLPDLGVIFGIIGVLGTLVTNFYFQWRKDRRAQREHDLAIKGVFERRKVQEQEF
jgi:multisubunit Na+/H+ antiporter MnhB subunit